MPPKHEPEVQPDAKALKDDIAALRRDFASLAETLRGAEVGQQLEQTLADLASEAKILYDRLSSQTKPVIDTVEKAVEDRPVIWIATAFVLGFIGSRLLTRR
jgi:ElaB/YqjD/DUF883 family membrane-anchored ribosome-binding protein